MPRILPLRQPKSSLYYEEKEAAENEEVQIDFCERVEHYEKDRLRGYEMNALYHVNSERAILSIQFSD